MSSPLPIRLSVLLLASVVALAATGCGGGSKSSPSASSHKASKKTASTPSDSSSSSSASGSSSSSIVYTEANVADLAQATDDEQVKSAKVRSIIGKVFQVQRDQGQTAVQMYTDPDNYGGNLIAVFDGSPDISEDDYIKVSGTGYDIYKGTNAFGADLAVPRIVVTSWHHATADDTDPPLRTCQGNQTENLGGVQITLRKIEISAKETRVYVKYTNESSDDFFADVSLTADGAQVDDSYSLDNKGPSTDLSPGAYTSGILTFEKVSPSAVLKLTYSGHDADFNDISVYFVCK
jgi:hypothetical protein